MYKRRKLKIREQHLTSMLSGNGYYIIFEVETSADNEQACQVVCGLSVVKLLDSAHVIYDYFYQT